MGSEARTPDRPTLNVDSAGVDEIGVVPWPNLFRRWLGRRVPIEREWALLSVVLTALFTVAFTITILVVSLQSIADEFGSSVSVVSWSITGPMLAFGVVGPAYGKAGDLWGHKRVFVGGLLGAGFFAALTALAWSAGSMIAFRTLSATLGAATGPATMAYINRLFPADQRVRPLSYWSFVNAIAPVLGVVVGAPVVEAFGWRVIFAVQAPMCVIGVVIALWLLPDTERASDVKFDVKGSVALGVAALSILAGVNQGPRWGWTNPVIVGLIVIGAISLRWFVSVERRTPHPLLPLQWVRTRNIALPILSQSLSNFAYMGGFLMAPLIMSDVLGYGTSRISLVVIARPLVFALIAPLASLVTLRIGERATGMFGAASVAASMASFAFVSPDTALWFVVVALALSGAGIGIANPALTSLVANAVNDRDLGVAGAMQQLMNQIGAVLGAVVMTTVQQATESGGVTTSYHIAFAVAFGIALVSFTAASFVTSTDRSTQRVSS